ncbi:MAG: DUF502 domain-containing protein [Candidatus Methylacidiphilales bacterium]
MDSVPPTEEIRIKPTPSNLVWWRNKFLTGLAVIIPVVATVLVLKFLYKIISGFFDPLVRAFVKRYRDSLPDVLILNDTVPFLAFLLTVLFVVLVGLLMTNVFGRKLLLWLEGVLLRIPLVNIIYPLVKQVVESVKSIGETSNQLDPKDDRQVVYLRYPGLNGYLIAFQTGAFRDKKGEAFVSVFIPTAPNPITGFVLIFKSADVSPSDLSMEQAWKLIVSAGFVTPKHPSMPNEGALNANKTIPVATVPMPTGNIQTE